MTTLLKEKTQLLPGRDREFRAYLRLEENIEKFNELKVRVEYAAGGMNYFSGSVTPRGYRVSLNPLSRASGMESYSLMSANQKVDGFFIMIETANRYNAKRLSELAKLIEPKLDELRQAYEEQNIPVLKSLCKVGKQEEIAPSKKIEMKSTQVLLTKEILERLPKLRANEHKKAQDVNIIVKFFDPTGSWSWFATEGEPTGAKITEGAFAGQDDYEFFGYVQGLEGELGSFMLSELSSAKSGMSGMRALPIERDKNYGFKHALAEVMKER
jgi:hypothetical protein